MQTYAGFDDVCVVRCQLEPFWWRASDWELTRRLRAAPLSAAIEFWRAIIRSRQYRSLARSMAE